PENRAGRRRKGRAAAARCNLRDKASVRVRIPGGLADRLLHRGTRGWSSQAERERADIWDRVEWLCEIRRRRIPENARWCTRVRKIRAMQRSLPWSPASVETISGHRRNAWLADRQRQEYRRFRNRL